MSMLLADFMPSILNEDEKDILKIFINSYIKNPELAWKQIDLEEWLMDIHGLDAYEAENFSSLLIDIMLENDLGYELYDAYHGEGYIYYSEEA